MSGDRRFVDRTERGLHNAAAYLAGGEVRVRYHKIVLPNYGVFDEKRYFVPGERTEQVSVGGISVGLSVCEDAWDSEGPFADYRGVPLVTNINGSPYHRRKLEERTGVLRDRAREFGGWIAYVNAVGGQDEMVFDGGSLVMGPDGEIACRAAMFEEELLIVDIDDSLGARRARRGVVRAAGVDRPGRWSSASGTTFARTGSTTSSSGFREDRFGVRCRARRRRARDGRRARARDALALLESRERRGRRRRRLAARIRMDVVPIDAVFDAYRSTLRPLFEGRPEDVTEENIQARIRGNLLMAISNEFGSLVLATGNKSEYAVGYATLYGDMAGGFAPIKDVPKTLVYELCRRRNEEGPGEPIPERVMTKPPSAELRPDQKDTDSLPPYEELDPIIEAYVEDDLGIDEVVARGHDRATVERIVRMIDRTEYKRRQAAPGIKITPKAFGRDRRMPITNRYVD